MILAFNRGDYYGSKIIYANIAVIHSFGFQPAGVTLIGDSGPGGRIVGGYFSKGKWRTLVGEVAREREIARQEQETERKREEAERRLTPLQRAERDLKQHEALCEDCALALKTNPTREAYQRFIEADLKLTELREKIAELRDKAAAAREKSAKARAKAQELARRKSEEELKAQQRRQQEIINAIQDGARVLHAASVLQTHRATEAIARAHLEKLKTDHERDEEGALFLLMNS